MRRFFASLVAGVALVLAPSAVAGKPVMTTEPPLTVATPSPNFSCVPYGYTFTVLATFTVERRYIRFYEEGVLVKEIRHVHFEGTLYKSTDLSTTIPYAGTFTRTLDVAERTVTLTGLLRYSRPNGSGMVAMDAGRTVVSIASPPTTPPLVDTGPTAREYEAAVCAALAAA